MTAKSGETEAEGLGFDEVPGGIPLRLRRSRKEEMETMKHAVALCLVLLLGMVPVAAADLRMTATVPFAFAVGGKILPAGEYHIYEAVPGAWAFWDRKSHATATCLANLDTHAKSNPGEAKLLFNLYEGQAFLSAVVEDRGRAQMATSKAERDLIARYGKPVTRTIIARNK